MRRCAPVEREQRVALGDAAELGEIDSAGHFAGVTEGARRDQDGVAQMQAAFCDVWIKISGEVLQGGEYFPDIPADGPSAAQVFKSWSGSWRKFRMPA